MRYMLIARLPGGISLLVCFRCGAVTAEGCEEQHDKWHEKQGDVQA